jgi:hypothetical protein
VSQHHGIFDDEVAYPALLPVVHVGAAYAREVDLEEDIAGGCELGDGSLFEADILDPAKDEGVVLLRKVNTAAGNALGS